MSSVAVPPSRNESAGTRVLVAEDNAVNREVVCELLRDAGFTVDVAGNGLEAVKRAQSSRYELILMDVRMPVMDGLEATTLIRDLPGYQTIPILALTANVFDEERALSLRAGMNAEISKPVDQATLLQALERWLPLPSASEAAIAPERDDDALRACLSTIPGLNIAKGLRFAAGRMDRYLKRLRVYAHSQAGPCHALLDACLSAHYEEARDLAHSLSGAAAFVGAEDVQQLARALESLLRDPASAEEIERAARATHLAETRLLAAIGRLPQEADALIAQ